MIKWLKQSNHWKHLLGGVVIGCFSNSDYCALYAGVIAAGCLEFKDKAHGGKWDWADFALTVVGAIIGRLIWRLL